MKSESLDDLKQHAENPCIINRYPDGSFSVDRKLYFPEIKCTLVDKHLEYSKQLENFFKRKDFDINNFEFKITQDHVLFCQVQIKDYGYGDEKQGWKTNRSVARQHVVKRESGYYFKVELVDVAYTLKRVQAKCLSASTRSGIPDKVAVSTDLDEFYCFGDDSGLITKHDVIGAIQTMNKASYGNSNQWYYDIDLNLVRNFNIHTMEAIGILRPVEALQIASQLLAKGNWAAMHGGRGSSVSGRSRQISDYWPAAGSIETNVKNPPNHKDIVIDVEPKQIPSAKT
jgi:hypothetical protein